MFYFCEIVIFDNVFEAIYAFLIFSNRSSIFSGTTLIFYKVTLYLVYMFQQESKFHQGGRKESLSYLLGFNKVFWVCIVQKLKNTGQNALRKSIIHI